MSIVLQLSGYDKDTQILAAEYPVPNAGADSVKRIALVPMNDPDVMGVYPLDESQVIRIAGQMNTPLNPRLYDYFLEAYEDC